MQHWFDRHRQLIVGLIGAVVVFIVLYQAWFYVTGALAVVGAVWLSQRYND